MAFINCFSPPCGYFIFSGTISIFTFSVVTILCKCSIASGLLFSIPIKAFSTPKVFINILTPTINSSPRSSIRRWSAVRYGSHSTPLIIRYSQVSPRGIESLTCVGNVAPPIPTMPISCIFLIISSCDNFISLIISGFLSIFSSHSSPSTFMIIAGFL